MSPLDRGRLSRPVIDLTPSTFERARNGVAALAKRFTKFKQNFEKPINIPGNVIGDDHDGRKRLDVGQIPED
jgi:hypothetical protein